VGLNAQVLGISIDHIPSLKAWASSLGGINYPLLSDFWPHAAVIETYGVLRSAKGDAERAIFIIDKAGIIRYVDIHDINQAPPNEEILAFLRKMDPEAAAKAPVEAENTSPLPTGGIVMYCTPWCGDCRNARAWLAKEGLPYTEVDISRDNRAAKQVRAWANGNQTTPTFEINGTIIVDFHPEKIKAALKG